MSTPPDFRETKGFTMKSVSLRVALGLLIPFLLLQSAAAAEFNCSAGDVTCLIAAINTANANPGADTINLAAGTYTATAPDNGDDGSWGVNSLPLITSPITIHGAGAVATVIQQSFGSGRILQVEASGILTLQSLTIQNGWSLVGGGGILNRGTVAIFDCEVSNNNASFGVGNAG